MRRHFFLDKDEGFLVKAAASGKGKNNMTFTLQHFAGDVTYNVEGWCEKNSDTPPPGCAGSWSAMSASPTTPVVQTLSMLTASPWARVLP